MLIKCYNTDKDLYIFDNAEAISVLSDNDKETLEPYHLNAEIIDCERLKPQRNGEAFSYIKFVQKEKVYYLKVFGVAYICNDDGITIERVFKPVIYGQKS
jgi:hypothetical protein